MIYDAYNDPYSKRLGAKFSRREFEKLKQTDEYKKWRKWQIKIQEGKCAYCRIQFNNVQNNKFQPIQHIDHVTPLYHEGKNIFENLVISCRLCNLRKYVSNKYVYPQWIKDNDSKMRRTAHLRKLRKQQKILFNEMKQKA